MNRTFREFFAKVGIAAMALTLALGFNYLYAWTAPTQNPPLGNVSAPLNVSAIDQVKDGGLSAYAFYSPGYIQTDSGICMGEACVEAWPASGTFYVATGGNCPTNWVFRARNPEGQWGTKTVGGASVFVPSAAAGTAITGSSSGFTAVGDVVICLDDA